MEVPNPEGFLFQIYINNDWPCGHRDAIGGTANFPKTHGAAGEGRVLWRKGDATAGEATLAAGCLRSR
ncbi:unnamed protein product [Lampetra planeri]